MNSTMHRLLAIALLSMTLLACGEKAADGPMMSNSFGSPEEACRQVLDALAAGDTLGLQRLILTRYEHDSILVPRMPIGRDTTGNKDLELAWYMLNQRSVKGMRRALADYAGQRFELVSVTFNRPRESYGPLTMHKGTQVTVRNEEGEEVVIGIFGSILEQNGKFKLVSIRD